MKLFFNTLLILICVNTITAQCPPTSPTTMTITGLYSADLNPTPTSKVYVTPTATITGNVYLNNSSLYNCGTILSKKITMRQSANNNQYVLENNNVIKCDTISLDSLGHLHNNDTLICNRFNLYNNTNVDNNYWMDVNSILIASKSMIGSHGAIKSNYFVIKDTNSYLYNIYGVLSVRKLLHINAGSFINGVIFICVDSCFINNGQVNNQNMVTWSPYLKVYGLSTNTGTISTIDFCDLTSTNGGMLDSNSGTLTNITYCTSTQNFCDLSYTAINENINKPKQILVYPNPTFNSLNIQSDQIEFENSEIEIINYLGQTVLKLPYSNNISVSTLSSGYYTLKIVTRIGQFHSSFIKE